MKTNKVGRYLSLKLLVLTLIFFVSIIVVPQFNQVFAERPDLIFMGIDDPSGSNQFRYKIGWNLGSNGQTSNWDPYIKVDNPKLGGSNDGGGAAIAYINDNDIPDLIFMGIDDPDGDNKFWYTIGWDLKSDGQASSWSGRRIVGGIGTRTDGECLSNLI